MADAERARARRITRSRVVLVVVALTVAALLILIVVGAMGSGETREIGQARLALIRPTLR